MVPLPVTDAYLGAQKPSRRESAKHGRREHGRCTIRINCRSHRRDFRRKKKRGKTREWVKRRCEKGVFNNLLAELQLEDPCSMRNWLRMDKPTFEVLAQKVAPLIKKKDTVFQQAISVEERLALTLRFMATGSSIKDISYSFRVGRQTASYIIIDTCKALFTVLRYTFNLPQTPEEWKNIAKDFQDRWNFPHCLGSIDGKHILIQKPVMAGSHYHNYKGNESIVLMAITDANLVFRYIDVGTNGRISDGGVWNKSRCARLLESGALNLPGQEEVGNMILPYVFVADDALAMKPYLLKPYPGLGANKDERIFNYRLSRARRCVESAFGILANRFRIFLKPIQLSPEKVIILVQAGCALHNFLRMNNKSVYFPPALADCENVENGERIPGSWRNDQYTSFLPLHSRHPSMEAKRIRQEFCKYFVSPAGAVFWQWNL